MSRSVPFVLSLFILFSLSACTNNEGEPAAPSASPQAAHNSDAPTSPSASPQPGAAASAEPAIVKPVFKNVSVHDPSIIKADGDYYVFGSHLAVAKSDNLMSWTQLNSSVYDNNPIIPNVFEQMKEGFAWAETKTFWAGDVIQLPDGKYYMYYSMCKGDSPRSVLGYAVADQVEGPYEDLGIILKSGMWNDLGADGKLYDATVHPNVVDPHLFFDQEGILWMVYGSYSGGIFIMKMDPETGLPYPDQGYGKKLLGNNHSRIEAPYILYNEETGYYYLYLSYGGLDAKGGYNIRVARSEQPDGPYYDTEGNDMINAHGRRGSFFDDRSIEPYGAKLMGNFQFQNIEGEVANIGTGYVSPGHNSAYYDAELGQSFLIFHTRFPSRGEGHEVRVHLLMMNTEGWPVAAPHRYAGEKLEKVTESDVTGVYKYINHAKDISADIKKQVLIELKPDGSIEGGAAGSWKLTGDYTVDLSIDGSLYHGVFLKQWDAGTLSYVMTFSALSPQGIAVWGSHTALE